MTHVFRCVRRCVPATAMATAIAAMFAGLAIGGASWLAPIGAVFAQTPGTAGPIGLGDLFGPDSVDLKPEKARELVNAARKAKTPGQCPLGALFIFTPKGDPIFQQALAAARRQAVLNMLQRNGVDATRFFVDSLVGGEKNDAMLDLQLDRAKPKLTTTSVPPKGKKVKARDKITVTMVARDDAEPKHWQTGIKTIRLVAESEGGRVIASENYEACTDPRERRVEATYTVPANPPPIVRLAALTEDHVGLMDTDVGEFPTQGDWYGTFGWTHTCTGGGNTDVTRGTGDLTLDYDGRGNLTGTLVGSVPERKMTMPTCSGYALVTPGTFRAKLLGSYTPAPDRFAVQAVDVQTTHGRATLTCPAGGSIFEQPFFSAYEGPMFRDAFRDLRRQPDDSRTSTGEITVSVGGGTCTTAYSLRLRAAQN
jgi:hypothetical protein